MKSSPLHQRVEFTFPAPGDLTWLNPFDTRDIGLRGGMTEPDGVLKVGVPNFANDIAGKLARR
jgi:hypothetical protein